MDRTIRVRKSKPMHLKPNYHMPVWHNDDWLQGIENKKIEDEKYTKEMEERNKELGLPSDYTNTVEDFMRSLELP